MESWVQGEQGWRIRVRKRVTRETLREIVHLCIWLQETDGLEGRLLEKGRVIAWIRNAQRSGFIGRVEDSVSTANDSIPKHVVREPQSGSEVVFLVRHQTPRCVAIDGNLRVPVRRQWILAPMCDVERIRRDVEARLSVVLLHGVCDEVVPKAEIEGEFLGHFEIV